MIGPTVPAPPKKLQVHSEQASTVLIKQLYPSNKNRSKYVFIFGIRRNQYCSSDLIVLLLFNGLFKGAGLNYYLYSNRIMVR